MIVWWIVSSALALAALNYVPPLVYRLIQYRGMRKRTAGRLVLTYDDGPDVTVTPDLLDLLESHGARASFYLVGFRAERHPEVCDRLVAGGQDLGCHSYGHANQWRQWPWKSLADTRRAYRTLDPWLDARAAYRPAYGKLTTLPLVWLLLGGRRPVWWTKVGRDATGPLPSLTQTLERLTADGGGVVLLHSFHKDPERKDYVLNITRGLLEAARDRGMTVCTLSELARRPVGGEG